MSRWFRGRQNITIVEFFHHDFLSNTRLHDARQQRGRSLKFERVGRERQQGFAAAFQIEHRFAIEQDEAPALRPGRCRTDWAVSVPSCAASSVPPGVEEAESKLGTEGHVSAAP